MGRKTYAKHRDSKIMEPLEEKGLINFLWSNLESEQNITTGSIVGCDELEKCGWHIEELIRGADLRDTAYSTIIYRPSMYSNK